MVGSGADLSGTWIPPALFLVGLAVGSFLNVVIHRLPAGESVVFPGSRCPACAVPIRLGDKLPVISWLRLGGRCRDCGARIPVRYPLVEVLTGLLFVWAPGDGDPALVASRIVLFSVLLTLAVTDWERLVLPDALTLPGTALGLLLSGPRSDLDLLTSAAGALLGATLLFLLRALWLRFRGIEAVGLGDVKLLLLIGAFLGPTASLGAVALAATLGVLVAGPLLLAGRIRRDTPLPFGALLALGAGITFVVETGF